LADRKPELCRPQRRQNLIGVVFGLDLGPDLLSSHKRSNTIVFACQAIIGVVAVTNTRRSTMRNIVVTEFLSLDGIMENPAWTFPYWNDEIAEFKGQESRDSDALLLGRVTYQGFAAAWPESEDEGADYFNNVRKYVVSTTLDTLEWNNSTLINANIVEEITKLKQQDGKDIAVHGSATLVQTLIQHDLVDRYRLLIYPVVLGKGKRLFQEGTAATLKLVEAQSFSSGVAALIYEPDRT
jgi:dihydrofolate reductase